MVFVESTIPDKALNSEADVSAWLAMLAESRSEDELALLRTALKLAASAHETQKRASGEPYLSHALAVADILVSLRLDVESVAAAILHDVVEDSDVSLEDIEKACGPAVARLVDGVTKMRVIGDYRHSERHKQAVRAESQRKMLLAMAEDVRVVLIKLADRLHNMRTLKHLPETRQRRIARETLDIYAPLANRLGIWQIKWELEDLSFRYLEPQAYKEIARALEERRVDRQRYIDEVVQRLRQALAEAGIEAEIKGRPKHIYSIWKKMQRKRLGFHQLYDVRAVRILVDSVADCYHALGIVHTLWPHIPREFDDYIATPKENNYQSIHTAVVGPRGKTLEVQIRTHEMDRHAELGVAAHWRYKEGGKSDQAFEQKINWLRKLLEWKEESADAGDFIDRFRSEAFQDRVYVLTPQGEIIDLPQGATPLDFAYYIHTEVGHRCRGAKVDGRIVPLTHELKSGEQVEILTGKQASPSRDWLNPQLGYLRTSRARVRVRHWFNEQDQQQNLADGRAALERELRRLGVCDLGWEDIADELGAASLDDMLVNIGRGSITTAQLAGVIHRLTRPQETETVQTRPPRAPGETGGDIVIQGVGNLLTNMARCCRPAPGDAIVGYITRGRGITIHRSDCGNVLNLDSERRKRLIEVEWGGRSRQTYPVDIVVEAIDRPGLLRDITTILANERVNATDVNTHTDRKDLSVNMRMTVEIADTDQLSRVIARINQLPNVVEARRLR